MFSPAVAPAKKEVRRGWLALLTLAALIIALRGLTLLYDHSLNSIDGALQTWFALDNFSQANQLGSDFQSYLGITMILVLLPVYFGLGQTLYASTVAANVIIVAGAFVSAYSIAWFLHAVPPRQRWLVAILLVFVFYYVLRLAAYGASYAYPASFDPGVSLRSLRGFLPFFVLPFFVLLLRKAHRDQGSLPGALLGLIAGAGLLWSNDAGIPLVIAMGLALVLALHQRGLLLFKTLVAFGVGVAVSAIAILMLVSHGEPGPWLQYNFKDVAGDQFWYFAPWDRSTRILGLADLPNILRQGQFLSSLSLVVLIGCVVFEIVKRLRGRGSPVRSTAFIFVGASVIGTALIPQVGGHIGAEYNHITFVLGACAPLIVGQRAIFRLSKPAQRKVGRFTPVLAVGVAASAMLAIEAGRLAVTAANTDRVVYIDELGFYVTRELAADLEAMQRLAAHWKTLPIGNDRKLLSVYTSALDIVAQTESPTPVGSLIHALGPSNRADFTNLVAERSVEAVTTIAPDYSGWEGWILRANWPFFRHLHEEYVPIARNEQHLLWVGSAVGSGPKGAATCSVSKASLNALVLSLDARASGLASVSVVRRGPFGSGRSALLTVTEASPATRGTSAEHWSDFPRYGAANAKTLLLVAPVEPGTTTSLQLELMDGSDIGSAICSAEIYAPVDSAALPGFAEGIERYLAGVGR